jgi:hypothetical protein
MGRGISAAEVRIQPAIIRDVQVDVDWLTVRLTDGRELRTPTASSDRLQHATPAQRQHWTLAAMGTAVHWPDLDEDIGVWTLLGVPEDLVLEAAGFTRPD